MQMEHNVYMQTYGNHFIVNRVPSVTTGNICLLMKKVLNVTKLLVQFAGEIVVEIFSTFKYAEMKVVQFLRQGDRERGNK